MSDTATAAPADNASTQAPADSGKDFLSFSDALDAGFEALNKTSVPEIQADPAKTEPTPSSTQEKTVVKEVKVESNPLDVLTKRLTGKEEVEPKVESEDLDIKTPENLKPEAQTAWARLTKDLRDARAKVKELETKVSEAPQNSTEQLDLKSQLDALKTERDEYQSELRLARLESTREYKQAVTEPLHVIQKEVAEIAKIYETDPRNIYAAMAEPDPAKRRQILKDATTNFDPVDSLALRNKAEELHRVFEKRELLHKDVQTVLDMIANEEKQETELRQKQYKTEIETAYKAEWQNIQKENPLLRPIQDNEAWNKTLQSIEQQALDIENTELDARSKARLTFNAAAMPVVMNVFQDYVTKAQARIDELEKLTKELRSTIPSAGSDTRSAPEIPSDLGFVEALERGMNKR
jgi:hypothetical protein